MPQTYTIGGDSWQDIKNDDISGQTFRPDSDFLLEWVDLWFDKKPVVPEAVVQIFYADAFHHPFGDCLSRNRLTVASEALPGGIHHVRLSMQSFLLTKDESYCIQVGYYPPIWGGPLKWRYDAGDATYPRGIRIQSHDHGETWTDYFDDDHMFALWGTPPVPPPPPNPPIANVAILAIEKSVTSTGMEIVVTTNVPCHLYATYSLEKPLRHDRSTTLRGLVVPSDTRWCFVNWTENEQAEEGDTIIHTFTKEPWITCETRYFVFRAKVDDVWVPTASPVFTIHREAGPETLIIKGRGCYWQHRHSGGTSWLHLADGPPNAFVGYLTYRVTNFLNAYSTDPVWRTYGRGLMQFELGDLSAYTVLAARIKLLCYQPYPQINLWDWKWAFFPYKTGLEPKDLPDYDIDDWLKINACPDTTHCTPFDMYAWAQGEQWRTFDLNPAGTAYAQEGGRRTWWIRSANEAHWCTEPAWARYKISIVDFYNTIPDKVPILELDVIPV